jgi:tellurite resistance protein TehA-like permease
MDLSLWQVPRKVQQKPLCSLWLAGTWFCLFFNSYITIKTYFHDVVFQYVHVMRSLLAPTYADIMCASTCTALQPALMMANSNRRCVNTQLWLHVVLIVHILWSGPYSFVHIFARLPTSRKHSSRQNKSDWFKINYVDLF